MTTTWHTILTGQSLAGDSTDSTSLSGAQSRPTEVTYFDASTGVRLPLEKANQWPERTLADNAAPAGQRFNINTSKLGGQTYTNLKKGTATYAASITALTAGKNKATTDGDTVVVRALHVIHGEANAGTARAVYEGYLTEWLADYDADAKTITGQARDLVGISCQTRPGLEHQSNLGHLDAHRNHPSWWLVGPKHHLPARDAEHLTNVGYYKLGEYHAKVHRKVAIDGLAWEPVHPYSITREGATVVARFLAPALPLAWDTAAVAAKTNYGFTYTDDTSSAAISSVTLTGADEVTITLTATPSGANPRLTYNVGNLRDSDPATSGYDAAPLHNWAVSFNDPIPFTYTPKAAPTSPATRRRSASVGAFL